VFHTHSLPRCKKRGTRQEAAYTRRRRKRRRSVRLRESQEKVCWRHEREGLVRKKRRGCCIRSESESSKKGDVFWRDDREGVL
jgi:hypothetical protein